MTVHTTRTHLVSFLVLGLLASGAGAADAVVSNEPRAWATSAELGAITTTGNTAGTSVTGKIDARHEMSDWSNHYIATAYFKEDETRTDDGETVRERSAERFSLSAKAAFKLLEEGKKLFVLGSHVDDKFGAYTKYSSMAVGHSTQLYKSPDKTLDVEIGPGYFNGTREDGANESGFTVRGAAALTWRMSPNATFSHAVSVERGATNVHSFAEAALSAKLNGTMQMKAAVTARNDSNVPEDKKNTDTQTSLTLVYSF